MPHINYLYDFVITVIIVHEDKLLLVNHPRYNQWVPIGGHIELDEDPEMTLFREIKEETGIKREDIEILSDAMSTTTPNAKFLLTPNAVDVHEANPPHKHISLTYFARVKNGNSKRSAEHTDMHWLDESELEDPFYGLTDMIKQYCREAMKKAKEWDSNPR